MRERGSAALELALGAVAILVPVAFMVLSFGPWLGARSFARLAAREVSRAYVVSDGVNGGSALVAMAETYGFHRVRLGLCGAPPQVVGPSSPNGGDECGPLEDIADLGAPDGGVSVVIEVDVPLVSLPWRRDDGSAVTVGGLTVQAGHTEYVDLYRSFGRQFSNSEVFDGGN